MKAPSSEIILALAESKDQNLYLFLIWFMYRAINSHKIN